MDISQIISKNISDQELEKFLEKHQIPPEEKEEFRQFCIALKELPEEAIENFRKYAITELERGSVITISAEQITSKMYELYKSSHHYKKEVASY